MEPGEKEEIRTRTDIVDLISGYTTLKKAGRTYKGICPFHQEKTPSFTVDPERSRWHCFGACSTGGDVFTFLMRAESLSFIEAAERLADRAGITLSRGSGDKEAGERARSERDRLLSVNALAQRFFRESFGRAGLAREYAAGRGLVHETLEAFGIGFAPDDWTMLADFLQKNGAHMADAQTAGLVHPARSGDLIDKFRGRLTFPIHDVQDRVVGFGGRLLVPAENAPKYLNSPETPIFSKSRILYGLNRARKSIQDVGLAVVVEGYMDVVAAHQAGFPYVVATLGTSLTEEHVRLLHRYTKNVVLSFDSDEAGVRAALRASALLEGDDARLRILALPPGDDPDSVLARGDAAGFRKAIESAVSVPEFRLRALRARCDTSTEDGKLQFLREALPILAEVRSVLERNTLLRRLAPYHPSFASGGVRVEADLQAELDGYLQRRDPAAAAAAASPPDTPSGPPVYLRGERVLSDDRKRRGGGSGGSGGYGSGGGGPTAFRPQNAPFRNGAPGLRRFSSPAPASEPPPALPRGGGAEAAEQILARAFLSPEWVHLVRANLKPSDFSDERTARLVEALLPLISGKVSPADAVDDLTDAALAEHANALLMAPDGEPLSEEVIRDCWRCLEKRRQEAELRQISAEVSADTEGNGPLSDELLRRGFEKARQMKGGASATNDEGETTF